MTARDQKVVIPALSRVFDGSVTLLGIVATVVFVAALVRDLPSTADLVFCGDALVIVIMCRFPLHFGRAGGSFEIGFEFCVLVFLACTVEPLQAIAVWSVGVMVGQLTMAKRLRAKLFNAGIGVIAGTLSLIVFLALRADAVTEPRELVAVAAAGAVYFLADYVVSGVSIALEERTPMMRQLAEPEVVPVLAAFLAIASLGYLTALVVRELPAWTAILNTVPVVTILVAVRARARGIEQARRLRVILDTSAAVQELGDERSVLDALRVGAADVLRDEGVELRSSRPGPKEIGVVLEGSTHEVWIVAPAVNRTGASSADDSQSLGALGLIVRDALARLELNRQMTQMAWHDPLTGLANRAKFLERLEHSTLLEARRTGRSAVLFCDLDGFKRVNDMLGHVAGDVLLVEVGRRLQACLREVDTVARLGGDEFAILLDDVEQTAGVGLACERLLESMRSRIKVLNEEVSITMTIGVAMSSGSESAETLLSHADLAMYHAKARGKNCYETYVPAFGEARLQRIELVERLREAIEGDKLEVYYQSVVDLRNREVYGVEALVRWRHEGQLVPPDVFIPAAEESGLIVQLGAVVLALVARDAPKLRAAAGRRIVLGINVSAQQLRLEHFAADVLAARDAMGDVDFALEVTERDFVNNDPLTQATMETLAAADIRFAVDDFGVGFSSIGYLKRLPVRILKIDKSFLERIEEDARACSLVRSIVVMGDALGLDVVVEGVERIGQLEHLIEHAHASIGQGYLFDRPASLEGMVALLSAEPTTVNWPPRPIDPGQSRLAAGHREDATRSASDASWADVRFEVIDEIGDLTGSDPDQIVDLGLAAHGSS